MIQHTTTNAISTTSRAGTISTYLYQRNGVYYFRIRVRKSNHACYSRNHLHPDDRMTSISLRTKDRRTAMAHSRHIKSALRAIHADNPTASYEEMRGHLKDIAEWELSMGRSDLFEPGMRDIYRDQYGELGENLTDALSSEPLSIDQHRYINEALEVLKACMKRIELGDSKSLIDYVDGFDDSSDIDRQGSGSSVSLSVSTPEAVTSAEVKPCVTVENLFEQYEAENAQNWKPATLRENKASHAALIEIFDYLGLNTDTNALTRADMLRVRDVLQQLPKNRKQRFKDVPLVDLLQGASVAKHNSIDGANCISGGEDKADCLDVVTINNKYLIKMAAVFKWAIRNDLIKKNMTEGLELKVPQRKASEARKAFSKEQVGQLLGSAKAYSQRASGKPYHYYVAALAAITGARLNEVSQFGLTPRP